MALIQAPGARRRLPVTSINDAHGGNVRLEIDFFTDFYKGVTPVANDIIDLGELEDGIKVTDYVLDADDLDTGAGLTLQFGILNAAKTDLATILTPTSAFAQAGGIVRNTGKDVIRFTGLRNTPVSVGYKVIAAAAGFAPGKLGATLTAVASSSH